MSKSTMVEMVTELEKIEPRTPIIDMMIREAKAGEYHDFKNQKYVCGKMASVELLRAAMANAPTPEFYEACQKIRDSIIDGEYDESPDEEDKASMRAELAGTSGGEAIAKVLGL